MENNSLQLLVKELDIPVMVTIREASRHTGLSYDALRKLCIQGKIIFVRSGSKYLINMNRLRDYLNGVEVKDSK